MASVSAKIARFEEIQETDTRTSNHRILRMGRHDSMCLAPSAALLAKSSLAASLPECTHEFTEGDSSICIGPGLDGQISRSRGFLCEETSQRSLPSTFRPWERVHTRLPDLLRQGTVRQTIDSLPYLSDRLDDLPQEYVARASLVLSTLAHAYYFAPQEKDAVPLPSAIDDAWVKVAERLDRPFTGRVVADDILNNAQPNGKERDFQLASSAFDLPEERLSSGLQGTMELEFAPALSLMTEAQTHVLANNDCGLINCLESINAVIHRCAKIFRNITPQSAPRGFDPVLWIKTYPALGNPVREGELGNSGADAPLFHALDAFVSREKKDGDLREMSNDRRRTFPVNLQSLLKALENPMLSVRHYVSSSQDSRLRAAFNATLQLYTWLLEWHRVKAVGITGVSLGSGRHKTSSGVKSGSEESDGAPKPSPTEMLSKQMKAGMKSRLGSWDECQVATVTDTTPGETAGLVTLAFETALPLEPGDRVQIWPQNHQEEVDRSIRILEERFGKECVTSGHRDKLFRDDASSFEVHPSHGSPDQVLEMLQPHKPRFYSIGHTVPDDNGLSRKIGITAGHGTGVSAMYLKHLRVHDGVRLNLRPCPKFNMPEDIKTHLVLIGQGSGIGPMVGFLRARARQHDEATPVVNDAANDMGQMLLYVGAKKKTHVCHLEELIQLTARLPSLTVKLALSQDNSAVVRDGRMVDLPNTSQRVTTVLQEDLATINSLLDLGSGHVFVCGSTDFGISVRCALGKAPKNLALSQGRDYTPPAPSDWKFYHEDLFGTRKDQPSRSIPLAELAKHNSFDDCWTALDGVVYDLTKYLALHPGGSKTLMESAGTSCDRRFYETHGGPQLQEVFGRLGPYAIGVLDTEEKLSDQGRKIIDTVVRSQNTLTNNTAFPQDRQIPFYAYCDALIVYAENGFGGLKDALGSSSEMHQLGDAQRDMVKRFTKLKRHCWESLQATKNKPELKSKEDEILARYLEEAKALHGVLDDLKAHFV